MMQTPTIQTVQRKLPTNRRDARDALAVTLFLACLVTWCGLFALTVWVNALWLKALCATVLGLHTGVFFILGHDASHGSLTSSVRFNQIAALVAFLPAFHPPTSWDWGHNRMHHSWTNLAGRDDGYPPLTREQWLAMSRPAQWLHRLFFTLPGMGFYYTLGVWWPHIICLSQDQLAQLRSVRRHRIELSLLAIFLGLQICVVATVGAWRDGGATARLSEVILLVVWPFCIWHWTMAFVTLQHHMHPRVRWFDNAVDWSYFNAQVSGTVHMVFPSIVENGFLRIFDHTAHHADKAIPLYRLPESQAALEAEYPESVIVQRASLGHLRDVLTRCRLYDYRHHRWMDFDGRYTT